MLGSDGFKEPRGEHHQHQLHFLSDALSDLRCVRIHSRRRSSTECLDGFNEPRGEHHQHQLHFLSDALSDSNPQQASLFDRMLGPRGEHHQHQLHFLSDALSDLRLFESTAGVAVRPNAWTDLTNHGASIISISCIFFQMPSPIRIHSRRRCSTECLDHGASIISISCISFQMPSPICGCSNPQQASLFDRMLGRI